MALRSKLLPLALLCSTLVLAQTSMAGEQSFVQVRIDQTAEPKSVVGLIISAEGTREIHDVSTGLDSQGRVLVSIPYVRENIPIDAFASAVMFTEGGQHYFAGLRPILTLEPDEATLDSSECPAGELTLPLQSQISAIKKLVTLRTEQRDVELEKVKDRLSPELLATLRKFEKGFGLSRNNELSLDLHPIELVDRLARLMHALDNYKRPAKQ